MARTTALNKIERIFKEHTFYKVVQGGTGGGKTYANIIICISYAQCFPCVKVDVVGMSYPQLDGDAIAIFKNVLTEQNLWGVGVWNETKHKFTFKNGSTIQFLSVDKMGAHGPRRHLLYCPEANSMPWDVFDQLVTRTKDRVLLDFNPTSKFWAHKELIEKRSDETSYITLTYKDNEGLSKREIQNIESHKPKPGEEPNNWWTVYGLGQIGSLEGNVYEGWIKTFPHLENGMPILKVDGETVHTRLVRYGLDFGFTNDETAMVAVYEIEDTLAGGDENGDYIPPLFICEKVYQKRILGSQYAKIFEEQNIQKDVLIVADSARPEIIAEIKESGYRIKGADKNAGSVLRGIGRVKDRQIYFNGKNLEQEYQSYAWRKTRTGETLDEPQDGNDHLMDALRYAIDDLKKPQFDF